MLHRLRAEGIAILYISHRLNEVMRLCDHVTVLKDGSVTADRPMAGIDAAGLVRLMVGRDPGDLFPPWIPNPEARSDRVGRRLLLPAWSTTSISSFAEARCLGIGGLVGQGQEDLLLGLYGAVAATARSATFNGAKGLPASVPRANAPGSCLCPRRP